ncbi:hypothetical protein RUM44_003985 [Polyplax serrata]|uniref:Uncharacterized protein n=1 Tax=Polyplax serrata TaxID=468196 RepID=A0ABR1B1I5_POLSC
MSSSNEVRNDLSEERPLNGKMNYVVIITAKLGSMWYLTANPCDLTTNYKFSVPVLDRILLIMSYYITYKLHAVMITYQSMDSSHEKRTDEKCAPRSTSNKLQQRW